MCLAAHESDFVKILPQRIRTPKSFFTMCRCAVVFILYVPWFSKMVFNFNGFCPWNCLLTYTFRDAQSLLPRQTEAQNQRLRCQPYKSTVSANYLNFIIGVWRRKLVNAPASRKAVPGFESWHLIGDPSLSEQQRRGKRIIYKSANPAQIYINKTHT